MNTVNSNPYQPFTRLLLLASGLISSIHAGCDRNGVPPQTETGPTETETRLVNGVGTFQQTGDQIWQGKGEYDGHAVELKIGTYNTQFDAIADYARVVLAENGISPTRLREEIANGARSLEWKFKEHGVDSTFAPEEFTVQSFYFHRRKGRSEDAAIIVLYHPSETGHWSIEFIGTENGHLVWIPKD